MLAMLPTEKSSAEHGKYDDDDSPSVFYDTFQHVFNSQRLLHNVFPFFSLTVTERNSVLRGKYSIVFVWKLLGKPEGYYIFCALLYKEAVPQIQFSANFTPFSFQLRIRMRFGIPSY